jgi:Zn-finger nucleic acid-binding protein
MKYARDKSGAMEEVIFFIPNTPPTNPKTICAKNRITNAIMHCPKDQTELKQFHDKNFPTELIIEQCPACNGLWLQRGEFQQYQEHRDKPKKEIVISDKDKKFNEQIDKILALYIQKILCHHPPYRMM